MTVYLASDHRGFELKKAIGAFLTGLGHDVQDLGPDVYDPQDDYPDFIVPLAHAVANDEGARGIVFGKTGEGEAMAVNRIKGARAAEWYGGSNEILTLSRQHNNANILSIGADFITVEEAKQGVQHWLQTPFAREERHVRRIAKLDAET